MHYASIDDVLGSSRHRYFGEGYRGVLSRLSLPTSDETSVALYGELKYPSEWSLKAGRVREDRHLGTIDALVLACRAAEILTVGGGRVKQLDIVAPTSPATGSKVPILLDEAPNETVNFDVGGLRVRIGLSGARQIRPPRAAPQWMHEWHGMSTASTSLINVDIAGSDTKAEAIVEGRNESPWTLEACASGLAVADVIAMAGAITEASVFTQAKVERDGVGNFWMRRARIELLPEPAATSNAWITTQILRARILERSNRRWHSVRVFVESEWGFRITADVAFESPSRSNPPTRP